MSSAAGTGCSSGYSVTGLTTALYPAVGAYLLPAARRGLGQGEYTHPLEGKLHAAQLEFRESYF